MYHEISVKIFMITESTLLILDWQLSGEQPHLYFYSIDCNLFIWGSGVVEMFLITFVTSFFQVIFDVASFWIKVLYS